MKLDSLETCPLYNLRDLFLTAKIYAFHNISMIVSSNIMVNFTPYKDSPHSPSTAANWASIIGKLLNGFVASENIVNIIEFLGISVKRNEISFDGDDRLDKYEKLNDNLLRVFVFPSHLNTKFRAIAGTGIQIKINKGVDILVSKNNPASYVSFGIYFYIKHSNYHKKRYWYEIIWTGEELFTFTNFQYDAWVCCTH